MNRRTLLLLVLAAGTAHAQSDTIIPNPKAVALRRVWTVQGNNTGDEVGYGAGSVSDINGDSINDIAILFGKQQQWKIFLGGPPPLSTSAVWTLDSAGGLPQTPVLGDFRGNGSRAVMFTTYRIIRPNGSSKPLGIVKIFPIDTNGIVTTPSDTTSLLHLRDVQAANLDGQPGDELVIMKQSDTTGIASLWFYQGGTDFQLQTPTAVLYDYEGSSQAGLNFTLGDLDGDHKLDLILAGAFKTGIKLKFYFSDENSPWSWATRPPDREITMADRVIGLNAPLGGAYDLDGDSVLDLVGITHGGGDKGGSFIYLSNAGKSAHTRSFTLDDADIFLKSSRFLATPFRWGYLNDSTRRYPMLELLAHDGPPVSLLLSGGPHGPDAINEAYYADSFGGYGLANGTVGDATGDGWDDFLEGVPGWGAFPNQGIAVLLAGGPYIPRDSATLSVRDVAVAGKADGLSLWPNPVHDELNIAWRGDLKRMPARFAVHDMSGKRVADGTVAAGQGSSLWRCADLPAGTYLLTMYAAGSVVLATAEVNKL